MYQLKRIICIDSYAQGLEIDVSLDQHANFNGDNGVGKTTFLQLIPIFYGAQPGQTVRKVGSRQSFVEYYLPRDSSYIIYEYSRPTITGDSQTCMVVLRGAQNNSGRQVQYLFIDSAYDRSLFMLHQADGGWISLSSSDLASRIKRSNRIRSSWLNPSQYKEVIQFNYKSTTGADKDWLRNLNEYRNRFSLCAKSQNIEHIEKVVLGILGRAPSFDAFKDIIATIIQTDIGMTESGQAFSHLRLDHHHIHDLMESQKQLHQIEQNKEKADELAMLAQSWQTNHENLQAIASLSVQLLDHLNSQIEKTDRERLGSNAKHETTRLAYTDALRLFEKNKISLEQQTEAFKKQLNTLDDEHKAYQQKNIIQLKQWVARLPQIELAIQETSTWLEKLQSGAEGIQLKYQKLQHEKENEFNNRISERQADIQQQQQDFHIAKDRIIAQIKSERTQQESLFRQKETHANEQFSQFNNQLGQLTAQHDNPIPSQSLADLDSKKRAEIKTNDAEIRHLNQQETAITRQLNDLKYQRQQHLAVLEKEQHNLRDYEKELSKLEAYLDREPNHLLRFLDDHVQGWQETIGKVIAPELLLRDDLVPVLNDGNSFFGIQLDLTAIEPQAHSNRLLLENQISAATSAVSKQKEMVSNCEQVLNQTIKEIKKAELQLQDVTNQLQKKNNHRHRLEEECAGIQLQQTEHIRQEKIRLQGEIERVNQELNMLTALKNQIAHERASVVQALQEKEQQQIKQQQQKFDEQRAQIEQAIGKIRQQKAEELKELQAESDRAMAEQGVDVETLRREEQKLQKLKKDQKQAIESRSEIDSYERWFTNQWSQKPLLEEKVSQSQTQLESNQLQWQAEEKQFKQQLEQLQQELTRLSHLIDRLKLQKNTCQRIVDDSASYYVKSEQVWDESMTADILQSRWEQSRKQQFKLMSQGTNCFSSLATVFTSRSGSQGDKFWQQMQSEKMAHEYRDWLKCVDSIHTFYEVELSQWRAVVRNEMRNNAERIISYRRNLKKYHDAISTKSRQLSSQLVDTSVFDAINRIEISLISLIDQLDFWSTLERFEKDYHQWQQHDQGLLPPDELIQLQTELCDLFLSQNRETPLKDLFDVEVVVHEGVIKKSAKTDKALENISSNGLSYLILMQILVSLMNLLRGKNSQTVVSWPVDELGNFSRENSVRLLGMLEKNQIRIASAFPDPDPELLQHFPYAYYIEKPHRNITTFTDQFGQLADELDEMLSGDAAHV
ncbi:ATP-binding protein [Tolumonas lignilytica]|uniref:ATP-binding protein n=1 Tax=Tolumonas lignilytica TaxID=1283284 RepID=UPI000464BDB6|nr:ATP-binding protein [Tolumonas lignilytica]